jgi:hypothetical protein
MIQLTRVHEGVHEILLGIRPGSLQQVTELTVPVGRYVVAGCFEMDLGGQILLFDGDLFNSVQKRGKVPAEFAAQGEVLHTLEMGGCIELQLTYDSETQDVIQARHIPTSWN